MSEQKARYISLLIVAIEVLLFLLLLTFIIFRSIGSTNNYEQEYFRSYLYLYGSIFVFAGLTLLSVFYKIVYHFFAIFELIFFVGVWALIMSRMHPIIIFFFVIMLLKHIMYYKILLSNLKHMR